MYRQSEKPFKQQYLLNVSPQYSDLRPVNGWDRLASLEHSSKFKRVSRRCRSTEVNQTSHNVWPSPVLVHYIYTFADSCFLTEFCQVQNSLCVQVLHSPLLAARYCTAFEQCASAKLRRAIFTRQGSHPFRHLAVELSSIFFSFHILLVGWSAAAVSFYCHLLLHFFYIYIYMLSPGPTSKCERNINGLCMRVLQSACRTTEMQFKSPKPNRQALLLTITWIHIHAPWIPGHFRGGPST